MFEREVSVVKEMSNHQTLKDSTRLTHTCARIHRLNRYSHTHTRIGIRMHKLHTYE